MKNLIENSNQSAIQVHDPSDLSEDKIKDNPINPEGLSAIPIIISEERHLFRGKSTCYVQMTIQYDGETLEPITIDSGQLTNPTQLINSFGMKPFADFGKNEWDAFLDCMCMQLSKIIQKKIYQYIGWEKGNKCFVFGELVIFPDHCEKVKNTVAPKHIVLSCELEETICAQVHNNIKSLTVKGKYLGYIIMSYMLLSIIKQRINEGKNIAPEFMLMLIGKTGSFKTSLATAFFNPMGLAGGSFADSEAAIRRTFRTTESGIFIIDDFKCMCKENNAKLETVTRMSGDIENSARRVSNGKVDNDCVTSMAVVTGEVEPHLQNSSYARILFVDVNINPINQEALDFFQRNQEVLNKFLVGFIQMIMKEENFDGNFTALFESLRNDLRCDALYSGMHARYYDMCAWIISAWRYYLKYLEQNGLHIDDDFEKYIKSYIFKQNSYFDDNPVNMFKIGYFELKNRNMINVITYNCLANADFDAMFEPDGDILFVKSNTLYKKICEYWHDNGRDFPCSEKKLRQLLKDEKILYSKNGKLTCERKTKENKSVSGYYLFYNTFKGYGGNKDE